MPSFIRAVFFSCVALTAPLTALAQTAEVRVDAPALAAFGPEKVGVMEKEILQPDQVDTDKSITSKTISLTNRKLRLLIWYPAADSGRAAYYQGSVEAETPPFKTFNIKGIATWDAKPKSGTFPIVLVSHGFANDVVMMSWIGENIASKGYVVVAMAHSDLPYGNKNGRAEALIRRPLDIAFALKELRAGMLGSLADTKHIGLVGYSMGGYGILTSAGAKLDAAKKTFETLPAGLLDRYKPGGQEDGIMSAGEVDALIAIAPGGKKPFSTWGDQGLEGITAPLLLIAGGADRLVTFDDGIIPIFEGAVRSDRTLLVFKEGGHNVGTGLVPPEMTERLWDQDWFDDPVWRKDRMNSISLHFMTAFLDAHLKGETSKQAYFDVSDPDSNKAPWKADYVQWDQTSDGGSNTAWKGFKRNQQVGLMLRRLPKQ